MLYLVEIKMVLFEYIELLVSCDYCILMKKIKFKESELKEVMMLIYSLNFKLVDSIVCEEFEYVIFDVLVKKVKGCWVVELNLDCMLKIRVNS